MTTDPLTHFDVALPALVVVVAHGGALWHSHYLWRCQVWEPLAEPERVQRMTGSPRTPSAIDNGLSEITTR